ncbi:hypothetical protein HMPREF9136_2204 [Prevotella dentalis DSM 3688]|uniref:Uncharacterized protein n=1 Tax=Prevotella dentalis (strain ATCC 49559 / DSM 3688 / JCM 13448 / NCTC 12043 / ES 2772) TaxID=908937 RepID=F9D5S6_PREDD|nr:hypothetical protein HMPREF9136_2204 [Prevotella dentalis DSM 3688]
MFSVDGLTIFFTDRMHCATVCAKRDKGTTFCGIKTIAEC